MDEDVATGCYWYTQRGWKVCPLPIDFRCADGLPLTPAVEIAHL